MHHQYNSTNRKLGISFLNAVSLVFKTISLLNLKLKSIRRRKYWAPVISIDNISFGGTGKSTLIMAIGEALNRNQINFAIVSRGYKGSFKGHSMEVRPHHEADLVGDEAKLFQQRFPNQDIFIGKDRQLSIQWALKKKNRVILLDDGFQSTHIHRDIKIMLYNPFHPYYYLRNFRWMMKEEDVVLTYTQTLKENQTLTDSSGMISSETGNKLSFPVTDGPAEGFYSFQLEGFHDVDGIPVDIRNHSLLAFSALGDNDRFKRDMSAYNLKDFVPFNDHYNYKETDLITLDTRRKNQEIEYLVCTEKDFIKLNHMNLENIPLIYARNSIKFNIDILSAVADYAKKESNFKT